MWTENKVLRLVSTDGSRLSMVEKEIAEEEGGMPDKLGILIPKKGLNEVAKFLSGEGIVNVGTKGSHFILKKSSETIIIRLLEGDFPVYQDIVKLPEDSKQLVFNKKTLLMMLKRMSILSSEEYKGVIFNFSEDKLVVSATNPDYGESREDMEVDTLGLTTEAAFNPRFFIDALNSIDTDNAILHIVNEERPCIVQGEEDDSFLSVIMPMRI
jgi:DNA polymerase-3 subunit beta